MIPALLMLALSLGDARLDRTGGRQVERLGDRHCGGGGKTVTPPVFAFAPADGAGVGTAPCACPSSITGSKGEAIAFTRASSTSCLKGPQWSNIQNGDMVKCAANQPVLMPGGDGTGPLGLYVGPAETNRARYSEQLDNGAAWAALGAGDGAAPTITADATTAPDGTLTAERLQLAATTQGGAGISIDYQQIPAGAPGTFAGIYVKGRTGSGTTGLVTNDGVAWHCDPCSYTSTGWTLCKRENNGFVLYAGIGNFSAACAQDFASQDIYAWGLMFGSLNNFFSTYIGPTTTADVSRSADKASASVAMQWEQRQFNADVAGGTQPLNYILNWWTDVSTLQASVPSGTTTNKLDYQVWIAGVDTKVTSTASLVPYVTNTTSAKYLHPELTGTQSACVGGVCTATNVEMNFGCSGSWQTTCAGGASIITRTLYLGGQAGAGFEANAVIKNVQVFDTPAPKATALMSDSISQNDSFYAVYATDAKVVVDDYGHSGDNFNACAAQWANRGTYNPKAARDTRLIMECGVNDIGPGAKTGTQEYNDQVAWVQARLAEGYPVLWSNITPYGGNGVGYANEAERVTFNSLWATFCASAPAGLACLDSDALCRDPADHTKLSGTCNSGDWLHISSAGGVIIAADAAGRFHPS